MIGNLNFCQGFPYFSPKLPQWPTYLFPQINKDITSDRLFDREKGKHKKENKKSII